MRSYALKLCGEHESISGMYVWLPILRDVASMKVYQVCMYGCQYCVMWRAWKYIRYVCMAANTAWCGEHESISGMYVWLPIPRDVASMKVYQVCMYGCQYRVMWRAWKYIRYVCMAANTAWCGEHESISGMYVCCQYLRDVASMKVYQVCMYGCQYCVMWHESISGMYVWLPILRDVVAWKYIRYVCMAANTCVMWHESISGMYVWLPILRDVVACGRQGMWRWLLWWL